jgi:hypothetical protein
MHNCTIATKGVTLCCNNFEALDMGTPAKQPLSKYYNTPNIAQLGSEHAAASIRWMKNTATSQLDLSVDECLELLGGLKRRTWFELVKKAEAHQNVTLNRDVMERFSLLIGIYKAMKLSVPDSPRAMSHFFNQPVTADLFQGKSVKQYLLEYGSMASLYNVRRYFDAKRG